MREWGEPSTPSSGFIAQFRRWLTHADRALFFLTIYQTTRRLLLAKCLINICLCRLDDGAGGFDTPIAPSVYARGVAACTAVSPEGTVGGFGVSSGGNHEEERSRCTSETGWVATAIRSLDQESSNCSLGAQHPNARERDCRSQI